MLYIMTYPNGEALWFEDLDAVLEHIQYDAYDLNTGKIYRILPGGTWINAAREIEIAIAEHERERRWNDAHIAYVSSPEKTGRT